MKKNIHPAYYNIEAVCACGNIVRTGSTLPSIKLDVCNACHPFFTGTQRNLDAEGRIARFNKRYNKNKKK
ncbi:MAG: 50S ribosomal protein L31 [Cyanobacteria bacterium P01_H01_bin.74]